jgi:hypothetical protein
VIISAVLRHDGGMSWRKWWGPACWVWAVAACGDRATQSPVAPGTGGNGYAGGAGRGSGARGAVGGATGDAGGSGFGGGGAGESDGGEGVLSGAGGEGATGGAQMSGGNAGKVTGAGGSDATGGTSNQGGDGGAAETAGAGAGGNGGTAGGGVGGNGGSTGGGAGSDGGRPDAPTEASCDSATCQNGGSCVSGSAICSCPLGYFGPDCSRSACDPNPCKHGVCAPSYWETVECRCESGWTGLRCSVDIDECLTDNGGCDERTSCVNVPGGRVCGDCPPGFTGSGASGCVPAACVTPADCAAAFGTPSGCADWQCIEGQCQGAPACVDGDADGVNAWSTCGCGAVDCNDGNGSVGERESCYTGPQGTLGVGACRGGERRCVRANGEGRCSGEITPSTESCNGADDDCNGEVDDGLPTISCGLGACRVTVPSCTGGEPSACTPLSPLADTDGCNDTDDDCDGSVDEDCATCLRVAPDGDDEAALATDGGVPFGTVQAAIDFAAASAGAFPRVCVAAGPACGSTGYYFGPVGATLTMRDGIDVLGNYESTTFTRCNGSTTVLLPRTDLGVYFPPSIQGGVALDGFTIEAYSPPGMPYREVFGITIDGARGVSLSNLFVVDAASHQGPMTGIALFAGADATLSRSEVKAYGKPAVRAVSSRVTLEANSRSECALRSSDGDAVSLEDSPGSRVEESRVCGGQAMRALVTSGNGAGTVVNRSTFQTRGDANDGQATVELESCGDSTLPFFGNRVDQAASGDLAVGVAVRGDCDAVIDWNRISASALEATAVLCSGSDCVVSNNVVSPTVNLITLTADYVSTGISCEGACVRVDKNRVAFFVDNSRHRGTSTGLSLRRTGALIDRNEVSTACLGVDLTLDGHESWSRIQNNVLWNSTNCREGASGTIYLVAGRDGEVDVHSNSILPYPSLPQQPCVNPLSAMLSVSGPEGSSLGSIRNNEIETAPCTRASISIGSSGVPPRLEHNQLGAAAPSGTLVVDRRTNQSISDIALVNALPNASGNRTDGDLIDNGTPTGAPSYDFEGNARDSLPDIGAYEAP